MKNFFLFIFIIPTVSFAQNSFRCDTNETSAFRKNNVEQQWEYKVEKKTKKKNFNSVREYDANGCLIKLIIPNASEKETYYFNEWEYDAKGNLVNYREGKIDKDSAKINSFSENYSYNYGGWMNRYRKDIYESEMSQTVTKWEYDFSDKGEKRSITYSLLRVRKDTIMNDEIKYSGSGNPVERTVHNYFPKGISDYTKYNEKGFPVDYMRYDKGKVTEHKVYTYNYDKQGQLAEEIISDGVSKTTEKKKYEKDKITYTKLNTKGKVLSSSSLPFAFPKNSSFPAMPAFSASSVQKKEGSASLTKKEKVSKKNKIVENYSNGKLVSTDTYNSKGLLTESTPAEGGFFLQYNYVSY
ncbi:MAG: hypothetical protein HY063_10320 [Bacteroidetes bacterium]|nr:hypothetical protein [Bacteroidota bacterium]